MKRILFSICSALFFNDAIAQDTDIGLGYAQTVLRKNALNFAVDYSKKLSPKLEMFKVFKSGLLSLSPELKIQLGSDDSFNGVTAKYTGNMMFFKLTTVSGVDGIPDLSKSFTNIPVSLGLESNKDFSFVNGLMETGYIPWYQNNEKVNKYLRQTKVGVFVQGGYKFAVSDSLQATTGGSRDESSEGLNDNIFRLKVVAGFDPKFYFDKKEGFGISLIGKGTVWYDLLNDQFYYNLVGKVRFMISKDYYFDLGYEKGSGAPNFNQGEQFTANLGVRF